MDFIFICSSLRIVANQASSSFASSCGIQYVMAITRKRVEQVALDCTLSETENGDYSAAGNDDENRDAKCTRLTGWLLCLYCSHHRRLRWKREQLETETSLLDKEKATFCRKLKGVDPAEAATISTSRFQLHVCCPDRDQQKFRLLFFTSQVAIGRGERKGAGIVWEWSEGKRAKVAIATAGKKNSTFQRGFIKHSTTEDSTIKHSTTKRSTIKHSTIKHSAIKRSTIKHSTIKHSTIKHSAIKHSAIKHSITKHRNIKHIIFDGTHQHTVLLVQRFLMSDLEWQTHGKARCRKGIKNPQLPFLRHCLRSSFFA